MPELLGKAASGKPQRNFQPENDDPHGSLMDHLRPTVVDMGEIQFPPMVPTRHSQPRGTSAPHQRGQAVGRLQRNQYPAAEYSDASTGHSLTSGATGSHLHEQRWPGSIGTSATPSGCARTRVPAIGAQPLVLQGDAPRSGSAASLKAGNPGTESVGPVDVALGGGGGSRPLVPSQRLPPASLVQGLPLATQACLSMAQDLDTDSRTLTQKR